MSWSCHSLNKEKYAWIACNRAGHVGVKYKNFMVIWGGAKVHAKFMTILPTCYIWIYEPITKEWYNKTCFGEIPEESFGACGIVVRNYLYIFGGDTHTRDNNTLYCLNLESLEWTIENTGEDERICIPLVHLVGWEHNNRLYYFGGLGIVSDSVPFEVYNNQFICYDLLEKKWSCPKYEGLAPSPRSSHAAAKVGNKVYIFGGVCDFVFFNNLHILDMDTMTWTSLKHPQIQNPQIPAGRCSHSLTALNSDTLVLCGGYKEESSAFYDCWLFNIKSHKWTEIKGIRVNRALYWHSACMVRPGEIICCGQPENPNLKHPLGSEFCNSSELFFLYFSPQSLLELCLDVINTNAELLDIAFKKLPKQVRDLVTFNTDDKDTSALSGLQLLKLHE